MLAPLVLSSESHQRAVISRAVTGRRCVVTTLRLAQRVSLMWVGQLALAIGPGRCREALGQNGPSAILILFSNFVFHFQFPKNH
jgi:putative hemolysin